MKLFKTHTLLYRCPVLKKRISVELLRTKLVFYASIPLPSIYNQMMPIDTNLTIDWY